MMFEFIKKLRKEGSPAPARLVLDLDSVVTDNIAFVLHGETHVIPPISTSEFLQILNALSALDDLAARNQGDAKLTSAEILEAYVELFGKVCPTITRKVVMDMTQPQVFRLKQLIMDCISGKIYSEELEIKKKVTATLQ